MKTFQQFNESLKKWLVKTGTRGIRNVKFNIPSQYKSQIPKKVSKLFKPKNVEKFLLNLKMDGQYLNSRNHLINLLDNICKKYNITFINPTIELSSYSQEQVMTSDLGHYTKIGIEQFSKYMNNFLNYEFYS